MVERFHRKSLTFPLAQLNKATEGIDLKFELYGEQVGARRLWSLLDTSHGSHTIIPRGTAKEIFYALNALLHTLYRIPKPLKSSVFDTVAPTLIRDMDSVFSTKDTPLPEVKPNYGD
jgi:hypothetical protein